MNKREQSAETTNEQSTEAQVTTSSHSNGNTHVVRSPKAVKKSVTKDLSETPYLDKREQSCKFLKKQVEFSDDLSPKGD